MNKKVLIVLLLVAIIVGAAAYTMLELYGPREWVFDLSSSPTHDTWSLPVTSYAQPFTVPSNALYIHGFKLGGIEKATGLPEQTIVIGLSSVLNIDYDNWIADTQGFKGHLFTFPEMFDHPDYDEATKTLSQLDDNVCRWNVESLQGQTVYFMVQAYSGTPNDGYEFFVTQSSTTPNCKVFQILPPVYIDSDYDLKLAVRKETAIPDPQAHFTYSPDDPLTGTNIEFDATTSFFWDTGYFSWDFNGDNVYEIVDFEVGDINTAKWQWSYGTAGTYNVKMHLLDENGETDYYTSSITVGQSNYITCYACINDEIVTEVVEEGVGCSDGYSQTIPDGCGDPNTATLIVTTQDEDTTDLLDGVTVSVTQGGAPVTSGTTVSGQVSFELEIGNQYLVTASLDDYYPEQSSILLNTHASMLLNLRPETPASWDVKIIVYDKDYFPVRDADVEVEGLYSGKTDGQGTVTFSFNEEKHYKITVTADGFAVSEYTYEVLSSTNAVPITLESAGFMGIPGFELFFLVIAFAVVIALKRKRR